MTECSLVREEAKQYYCDITDLSARYGSTMWRTSSAYRPRNDKVQWDLLTTGGTWPFTPLSCCSHKVQSQNTFSSVLF